MIPSNNRCSAVPKRNAGQLLQLARCLALTAGILFMPTAYAGQGSPKNVLFIVVDDLRPELGCYGVEGVISPNFDRLAKMGMLCRNAYAQYPVCNPSRSSFLSGLRPDQSGIVSNSVPFRTKLPETVSLPQLFRENGYRTAGIGKIFHLGQNPDGKPELFQDPLSWDVFYDGMKESKKLKKKGEGRNLTDGRLAWCQWQATEGGDELHADGLNADAALAFLEENHEKPFFLAFGLHKPHDPFVAPKKYFDLYPDGSTVLAETPDDRSPRVKYAIPNGKDFESFTDKESREFKRAYHACVSFADAQLGKIFESMDRLKLWESTMVVLIGDHGYHLGEHGWWNKVTVHEFGSRAPMIAWVPGAKGMGKPTEALIEFVDLYPTMIDYAGLKAPHELSGVSLRPVFDEPSLPGKKAAFSQVVRGQIIGRSVRTSRWRYTEWGPDGEFGTELYDHDVDKSEYHNQAANPERAGTRSKLKKLLEDGFAESQ